MFLRFTARRNLWQRLRVASNRRVVLLWLCFVVSAQTTKPIMSVLLLHSTGPTFGDTYCFNRNCFVELQRVASWISRESAKFECSDSRPLATIIMVQIGRSKYVEPDGEKMGSETRNAAKQGVFIRDKAKLEC